MNLEKLGQTASALMADGKGLLAMDESIASCNKRFGALGIPENEEMRRQYRELIITTPHLGESISGLIFCDETIRQGKLDGTPFTSLIKASGMLLGIKVDTGEVDLAHHPNEKIAQGLDGLANRLQEYANMGALFTKWRAEFTIGKDIPTAFCMEENAKSLAQYAALCQQAGLVPIVEPEVMMTGNHTLSHCAETTEQLLHAVFSQLHLHQVALEGIILKPNMILAGLDCPHQENIETVADATVQLLQRLVPLNVSGIAFLSGGQSYELASARLNAMNQRFNGKLPWALTFSYSRAIQQPALEAWNGDGNNIVEAQEKLLHRAKCNSAARKGLYNKEFEHQVKASSIAY